MSLTIDHVELNGCRFKVDLDKLPDLSDKVRGYFHKISSLRRLIPLLPPRCHSEPGLRKKIKRMDEVVRMAKETQSDRCQNKFIALIKTAVVVFSLAFTIKFTTTGDENDYWMVALASVCYIYFATSFYNGAKEKIEEIEELRPRVSSRPVSRCGAVRNFTSCSDRIFPVLIPSFLGAGMVLPLYESQTRSGRLKTVLKELEQSIRSPLEAVKTKNKALLIEIFEKYRGNFKTIDRAVREEAEALVEIFTQNSSEKDRLQISNLRVSIDACYAILEELVEMDRFYQRVALRIADRQSEESDQPNREDDSFFLTLSDEPSFSLSSGKKDVEVSVELQIPLLKFENYIQEADGNQLLTPSK